MCKSTWFLLVYRKIFNSKTTWLHTAVYDYLKIPVKPMFCHTFIVINNIRVKKTGMQFFWSTAWLSEKMRMAVASERWRRYPCTSSVRRLPLQPAASLLLAFTPHFSPLVSLPVALWDGPQAVSSPPTYHSSLHDSFVPTRVAGGRRAAPLRSEFRRRFFHSVFRPHGIMSAV